MKWLDGNRKLVAFGLAMFATLGLSLMGKLDETSAAAVAGLLALFVGGNTAEHFRAGKQANSTKPVKSPKSVASDRAADKDGEA